MGGTGPGLRSVFSFLGRFFSKRLQREAPDPGGTDVEVIDEVPPGRGCLEGLEPAPCVRRRALLTDAASELLNGRFPKRTHRRPRDTRRDAPRRQSSGRCD